MLQLPQKHRSAQQKTHPKLQKFHPAQMDLTCWVTGQRQTRLFP